MRKTKKLLSLLTAVTMAASAFSAIVVPASAADGDDIVLKATNAGVINTNSGYSTYDGSSSIALNGANQSSSTWGSDGIVEFSVPTIPDGYKINTATLDVYVESDIQNRASYRALGAIGLDTKATINGFSSTVPTTTGTTYDAQDIYLSAYASYADGTKAGSWDVSDYVKTQVDAEDSFIQFYLDAQFTTNATSAHGWTVYGYNTDYAPTLTITLVSTDTATYTVTTNYVDESNNTVAASVVAEDVTEGTLYTPTYETEFNKDGYKYTYKSGGDAVTVTGDTTITVVYSSRELAETTYTVTGVLGEATKTLATDTITEDSTVTVGYPKYVIGDDGVLYSVAAQSVGSNYHSVAITGTQADQTVTVTYSAETATPVYYAEMEDVLTNNNVSNAALRCSNGAGGNLDDSQTIATLSAGTYVVTTAVWGGSNKGDSYNSTYVLTAGDTTAASATTTGSLVTVTGDEFTLTEDTDLVLTKTVTGTSGACVDYILITGTGTATSDDDDDEPTEPSATDTPIPEEEATGTPIPEEEATGTPIPEEEEATPIPAGTVLYEQDYEDATAADFTTSTSGRYTPMLKSDGTNTWVGVDMTTRYNNGATLTSPNYSSYVSDLSSYAIEFDAALGYTNGNQLPWLKVNTSDGGYLLYLVATSSGTNWTINESSDSLTFATSGYTSDVSSADAASTSTWYHYELLYQDGNAALTVTDMNGDAIYEQSLIVPSTTSGSLTTITFGTQRYYANFEIDNIVIRTLEEDEFPKADVYTVNVNTTRYATMTLADGTVRYADVDGNITLSLVANGTVLDYTISKVGYTSVTGSATVEGADVTIDAELELDADHADYIYFESDFGDESGSAFSSGSRTDSISLGTITLPDVTSVSVDFTFGSFSSDDTSNINWALVTDAGSLVGIQVTKSGLYAWTGWSGSSGMNQYTDIEQFTNGVLLSSDYPTGDFTVDFVIDKKNSAITVTYGDVTSSISYSIEPTTITGLTIGMYREGASMTTNQVAISEPDAIFMSIAGDSKFAVIPGVTVTREYTKTETLINDGETFEWTLTDDAGAAVDGVTVTDGIMTVADTTAAGSYTLTATGSTGKSATLAVEITEPATIASFDVDYPLAMNVDSTNTIVVTNVIDDCDDDVTAYILPSYTSLTTDVLTVDTDGTITALASGDGQIQMTIGNSGKETVVTYDITVDEYYVTAEATGDSTVVDVSSILDKGNGSYVVTTSKDGVLVSQKTITSDDFIKTDATTTTTTTLASDGYKYVATYDANGALATITMTTVSAGDAVEEAAEGTSVFYWDVNQTPITIETKTETVYGSATYTADTTGADSVEIAPVYETTIGTVMEVPADTYNVTVTANNGRRTDVYVNDQMIINNLNQGSDSWTVTRTIADSTDYEVGDVVIAQGYAEFNLQDDQSSGATVDAISFVKAPSIVDRAQRVYVLGDSLVAKYYGEPSDAQLARTGWGDVLANYLVDDVEVTNLANSGVTAIGLYTTAFSNVLESAQAGDIMILESGYNDYSYSTSDEMMEVMAAMVEQAYAKGVTTFIVTPNASTHGTGWTNNVRYSSYIRELAEQEGVSDKTTLIDLCALSYSYLSNRFESATDEVTAVYNNSADKLHSSGNAANCWAAIVANALYNCDATKDIVDTDYTYTFTDSVGEVTVNALTFVE